MKYLILKLILLNSLIVWGQSGEDLKLLNSFMDHMKKGKDIRVFISKSYITDNGLSSVDWQCDYLLVKRYLITSEDDRIYLIKVDHGSGKYCTSIRVKVTTQGGQLVIVPSNHIFSKAINKYIVVPWFEKYKIC